MSDNGIKSGGPRGPQVTATPIEGAARSTPTKANTSAQKALTPERLNDLAALSDGDRTKFALLIAQEHGLSGEQAKKAAEWISAMTSSDMRYGKASYDIELKQRANKSNEIV